jgi:serine/threonine protein kinase
MEFAEGGELMAYITEKEGLDEIEGRFLFRQLVLGIEECHT